MLDSRIEEKPEMQMAGGKKKQINPHLKRELLPGCSSVGRVFVWHGFECQYHIN